MALSDRPAAGAAPSRSPRSQAPVGWTLLAGLLIAVAVMVLGLILAAVQGGHSASNVLPLDAIWSHLTGGDPSAVLDLGILALFATPVAGVAVALGVFVRERDMAFVAITALLLVIIAVGFAIALR